MRLSSEPSFLREQLRQRIELLPRRPVTGPDLRHAAVGIVVLEEPGEPPTFVLTRRTSRLRKHAGQWALPGGKIDPGETPPQTVLREAEEEVGLRLSPEDVLGQLDDYVTRSGFRITPVVVWAGANAALRPNAEEVARAYKVPLDDLDHPEAPIVYSIPESERPVLCLPLLGHRVHAPTAAVLYQFLEICVRGNPGVRVAHYEQPVFAWR